ncbi:MAG: protein kinase [Candidatus Obscuribacterales bacterium]|nr:protein kinase [Candidatus Obscuribacterales bacterium]
MDIKEKTESVELVAKCDACGKHLPISSDTDASATTFCQCATKSDASNHLSFRQVEDEPKVSLRMSDSFSTDGCGPDYELLELIGIGGMGTVYKALDKTNQRFVAIKILKHELIEDPSILKRFQQEAASLQHLCHENVTRVYAQGQTTSAAPFIVMELIEGISLLDLLEQRGNLPIKEAVTIFKQTSEAVAYAHANGVVHRDLKPSNIMLISSDTGYEVRVVDFGISKFLGPQGSDASTNKLTQTGEIFGSPAYMSPEQCLGERIDERSDIYSLGCIMYETLTGKNPYFSENPVKAIVNHMELDAEPFEIEFKHLCIPHKLENIVLKCLRQRPELRYKSAELLVKQLSRAESGFELPAGLLRRSVAAAIDIVFLGTILLSLSAQSTYSVVSPLWVLHVCIAFIAYVGLLESSPWQSTPGKRLLGIRACDDNGEQLTVAQSAGRALVLAAVVVTSASISDFAKLIAAFAHLNFDFYGLDYAVFFTGLFALLIPFGKRRNVLNRIFGRTVRKRSLIDQTTGPKLKASLTPAQLRAVTLSVTLLMVLPLSNLLVESFVRSQPGISMVTYFVPKSEIPWGKKIEQKDFEEIKIIANFQQKLAIDSRKMLEGRIASQAIKKGAVLLDYYFYGPDDSVKVIVAKHNIPKGAEISANDLEEKEILIQNAPPDLENIVETKNDAIGKHAQKPILKGALLKEPEVADPPKQH